MTEVEWLECDNPTKMLNHLEGKVSERKFRLFAVACCRFVWNDFGDNLSRKVIEVAERQTDGLVSEDEWNATSSLRMDVNEQGSLESAVYWTADPETSPGFFAKQAAFYARSVDWKWLAELSPTDREQAWDSIEESHEEESLFNAHPPQADLIRDIFGDAIRPISIAPSLLKWRGGTIPQLAQRAYEEREMPGGHLDANLLAILADALEEAGCSNIEVLDHLRQPDAVHVRGCWVVDLLLEKE